jgi:hypothetical protein
MEVVASLIDESALPGQVYKMTNHGTRRTSAPVNERGSVMGVFFTVKDSEEAHEKWRPPMYVESSGSIDSSQVQALVGFLEDHREARRRRAPGFGAGWWMTVRYHLDDWTQIQLYGHSLSEGPGLRAVSDWANRVVENGCSVGELPVAGGR